MSEIKYNTRRYGHIETCRAGRRRMEKGEITDETRFC